MVVLARAERVHHIGPLPTDTYYTVQCTVGDLDKFKSWSFNVDGEPEAVA